MAGHPPISAAITRPALFALIPIDQVMPLSSCADVCAAARETLTAIAQILA